MIIFSSVSSPSDRILTAATPREGNRLKPPQDRTDIVAWWV